MRISYFLTGALALSLCSPTQADYLEEILVVANRVEQPLANTQASVEIIDRELIAASQSQDLLNLLSGRAGISLARDGGTGKNTSLFLRGTDSDHTLVYIDNQPVNGLSDGRARLEYLPLDQFERIEIVRGARSSIYGSEAIGGVIRLFTRHNEEPSLGGNLSLVGGSHDHQSLSANAQASFGSTNLQANFSDTDVGGFDSRVSGNPDKDGYNNQSWQLSADHQFANGNSLSVQQGRTEGSSKYDDSSWAGGVDGNDDYLRLTTSVEANLYLAPNWQSTLTLGRFKDAFDSNGVFGPFISDSRQTTASWINEYQAESGWVGTLGVVYHQDTYESNFLAEENRDNLALLAFLDFGTQTFPLSVSIRNDQNEQYGSHTTGGLTAGYNSDEMGNFWASFATAFKAPNFFDLYGFGGDPDLQPEESTSAELGWRYLTTDSIYSAALFRIRTENLIEFDNTLFQIFNIGDAEISGLELSAETNLGGYALGVSFTHLKHENLDTGEELVRRPRNTLRLNAGREFGDLTLSLVGLAQSSRSDIGNAELRGYEVLDVLISYQLLDYLTLRGKVGNLFDRDYQLVDGFNTASRTYQATLNYSF
jgi:vitamin B12 transporter